VEQPTTRTVYQWDEAKIDERGKDLSARIVRAWPGPDSDVWPATDAPVEVSA